MDAEAARSPDTSDARAEARFDARAALLDRSSDTSAAFADARFEARKALFDSSSDAFDARELAAAAGSSPAAPAARPATVPDASCAAPVRRPDTSSVASLTLPDRSCTTSETLPLTSSTVSDTAAAWVAAAAAASLAALRPRQASDGLPSVSAAAMSRPPSRPTFLKNWICCICLASGSVSSQKRCPASVVGTREAASAVEASRGNLPSASIVPATTFTPPSILTRVSSSSQSVVVRGRSTGAASAALSIGGGRSVGRLLEDGRDGVEDGLRRLDVALRGLQGGDSALDEDGGQHRPRHSAKEHDVRFPLAGGGKRARWASCNA